MKIGIDLDGVVIDSETTFKDIWRDYWKIEDKLEICQKENVDIMIDDDWKIIKKLADNKIKTLYFRDTNLVKLKENEYIKEVNNWGDIYRNIKNEILKKINFSI